MSRFVDVKKTSDTGRPAAKGAVGVPPADNNRTEAAKSAERIAKYIPAEIIAGYSALIPACLVIQPEPLRFWFALGIFLVLWVCTPLYLIKVQKAKKEDMPQVWIATISFIGWAYCLSGPFALGALAAYYNQPAGL